MFSRRPKVTEIDPTTLKQWMDGGQAAVVDVREVDEHACERLAEATLHPLSSLNPARIPAADGRRLVLHCKAGRRSMEAATRLVAAGHTEVYSLRGGLEAWKAAGLPVQTGR